jgi:DNA modification methylase
MLDINRIYNESCITGMQKMDEECVDLVVTSPPYDNLREYNNSSSWNFDVFIEVAFELTRVLKPGGIIMWNVGDAVVDGSETGSSFRQALHFKDDCGLRLHDTMLYQKPSAAYPAGDKSLRYSQVFEYCFILSKGKPKTVNLIRDKPNAWAGTRSWGNATSRLASGELKKADDKTKPIKDVGIRDNIWRINNGAGFGQKNSLAYKHPATMPAELARDHILSWSNEGDLVLDPFSGSGTTARMAFQAERNYIGFEIDEEYYKLAQQINSTEIGRLDDFFS